MRFKRLLFLAFPLAACSAVQGGVSLQQPVEPLAKPLEPITINAVELQSAPDKIAQTRLAAYSTALGDLTLVSRRYPDVEPVIQSLVDHPAQTFEMFDGCLNYWSDFAPPNGQDAENWQRNKILTREKHFPGSAGFDQAYPQSTEYTQIHAVAPDKHLVVLTCWLGPYWTVSANYLYDKTQDTPQVKPLALSTFDSKTGQVVASASNMHHGFQRYDETSRTLQLSHRFTGSGDCGYGATYSLENDEFVLQRFAEKRECDGLLNRYPQVYP